MNDVKRRLLPLFFLLLASVAALGAGCSCRGAKPPEVGFIGLTDRDAGGDDLRTGSRMGAGGAKRPDGRFTGRALSVEQLRALNDAGKQALKDPYFQAAMAALEKKDLEEAARQMQYAAGNLPNNEYVGRYVRRVDMYRLGAAADADEALKGARKSLAGGMADTALTRAGKLAESPNPFLKRQAHYVRMNALEALGREDEAVNERMLWLETKLRIGEIDADCYAPAVDPAK